jgi:hypothetical protein
MCECKLNRDGVPQNTVPATVHICCDARKATCQYAKLIEINNEKVSFHQCFCTYPYRRDKPITT